MNTTMSSTFPTLQWQREHTVEELCAHYHDTALETAREGLTPELRAELNNMTVTDFFALIERIIEEKTRLSRDALAAVCPM